MLSTQNRAKLLAVGLRSIERNKCIFGCLQMLNYLKSEFPRKGKLDIYIMAYAGFCLEIFRLYYMCIILFSFRCNGKNTEFSGELCQICFQWTLSNTMSVIEITLNLLKISANITKKLWIKTKPKLHRKYSRILSLYVFFNLNLFHGDFLEINFSNKNEYNMHFENTMNWNVRLVEEVTMLELSNWRKR